MINTVTFIGHLGNDAELRYMPLGSVVANFSVAVSERWSDKERDEKPERVHWFNRMAFWRLAEF